MVIKQASELVNAIIRNNCTFECGILQSTPELRTRVKFFSTKTRKKEIKANEKSTKKSSDYEALS